MRDGLDALCVDHRVTKTGLLAILRDLLKDLDERIAYVAATSPSGYRFATPPEKYSAQKNRSETPDKFFGCVYGEQPNSG
ncbi:hypothetical protein [Bradyrhizobium sp. Ec3.3]|uniref:hypothetical protein n=1 Tax=Bradyrhizobium sp. Ec3.3 TaxID=189753 RepID=UPI000484288C|nr:hypothetical protein [Bradyrhizobium sp. Ec3.3]